MPNINSSGGAGERASLIDRALGDIATGEPGDVITAAYALTRWGMRLLGVEGAGVMMSDGAGVLRSMAVSSDAVRVLEAAELEHGRGPCVESHRSSRTLFHADTDVVDGRWPQFGGQARAAGMRAAYAVPVLSGGTAIGVLNLFRSVPGALSDEDAALARSLADATGVAVSTRTARLPAGGDAEQVRAAFTDAAMMERAIGMLAVRLAVDLETAAAVLRLVARDTRQPQPVLASAVISGEATIALPLSVTFAAATGELV